MVAGSLPGIYDTQASCTFYNHAKICKIDTDPIMSELISGVPSKT